MTLLAFSPLLLGLSSCADIDSDKAITESDFNNQSNEDKNRLSNVQDIFYAIPSPIEMASLLRQAGSKYDSSILNDIEHVNNYVTSRSKALNLGIYGSDLSYTSIFNQNQESIIYLSCAKKLADKLGVSNAFDNDIMERMEANVDNRDSLLSIVSESYYALDAYLKENDRDNISAMVITGGWIEGLYLATAVAEKSLYPDEALLKRIAEQKISLQDLIKLVNAYNRDGSLNSISDDLASLNSVYDEVTINSSTTSLTDDGSGVTTIGGQSSYIMSDESLLAITKRVAEIRNSYTK